jgi:hypothetical protein
MAWTSSSYFCIADILFPDWTDWVGSRFKDCKKEEKPETIWIEVFSLIPTDHLVDHFVLSLT